MKLVIDIPENIYECVKKTIISDEIFDELVGAFRKSEPLPKGHGALKDTDAIRKTISESIEECKKWANEVKGGEMYARVSQSLGTFVECSLRIKNAPTIIEADTESEE